MTDADTKEYVNVQQRPGEICRVYYHINRGGGNKSSEARDIILQQLAFENAMPTCQSLMRTTKKSGNISNFIKAYTEVTPSCLEAVDIAAKLQGQTVTQI